MPQTRIHRPFEYRLALLGLLTTLLCGCHTMALQGKPSINNKEAFKKDPPRSLAILPTTDISDHADLLPQLRKALFTNIAPLPYEDRELKTVDDFLAQKAAGMGIAPDKLDSSAMADPKLADCVIYSELVDVSRFYLLLYAHYRFDLNLVMVDTRTRDVIYRNHFVFYDRVGSPAYVTLPIYSIYAFVGVAGSSVESLWHLRSSRLEETFDEGAKRIAETLPVPALLAMSPGGKIHLDTLQVVKPFPVLNAGEKVIVKAQGTPGCQASFSVGKIARAVPMQENTPGSYFGLYEIRPGDNADYAIVEMQMAAKQGGDKLDYTAAQDSFAIDTTTPPRARISAVKRDFWRSGVSMKFEVDAAEAKRANEKKLEYQIFKKNGAGKFDKIGDSAKPSYRDAALTRGEEGEYYVLTRDEAGNVSNPWEIKKVKLD